VPSRLWPPAPIARCLAVPEVDGNRFAKRRPNDDPRLSKRRWRHTCRHYEDFRRFRSWRLTGRSACMFVATQMTRRRPLGVQCNQLGGVPVTDLREMDILHDES
jgi:hypothetical protein